MLGGCVTGVGCFLIVDYFMYIASAYGTREVYLGSACKDCMRANKCLVVSRLDGWMCACTAVSCGMVMGTGCSMCADQQIAS